MNRFVIVGILAALLVIGLFVFRQQPAETPIAVEEAPDLVVEAAEEVAAASTLEVDPDAQPEMVEESAAADEESQADQPILLAQADTTETLENSNFKEGTHYYRIAPTQPTVGGADKIEVAEIFWYGCNHCYDFEPHIDRWLEGKPANVRFVRIPATWNPLVKLHAQLYYTEEVLVRNDKIEDPKQFRSAVFAEYHRRGNRMASEDAIQAIFERHGVSAEDFKSTWSSFEVAQKLRVAEDLARRYEITSVPAVVVNGKFRSGAGEAGGYPKLMDMVDELIESEATR